MEESKSTKPSAVKSFFKRIYEYWRKRLIRSRFKKYKSFNKCIEFNGMAKLSDAIGGTYRFIAAHCDEKLGRRLLEMGFVPGEDISILTNTGRKGSIMVKIKGSKIVLSNKIAENILIKRKERNGAK
ncbi:MAG: ferrous iron transport protein A [Endomicrobia bacterium]|nr:ferrous iron transport protein A [Endomicrobiia bacterium]MCL2506198.1 ferrous iron transport protein A [Endomicrobiia bacterium]